MSFSGEVKKELASRIPEAKHCQMAELAAIISQCGTIILDENEKMSLKVQSENVTVLRKCFTLLEKAFTIDKDVLVDNNEDNRKNTLHQIVISSHENALLLLQALKMVDIHGNVITNSAIVSNRLLQGSCCRRAFLRGVFLVCGSISDPMKFYHLELITDRMGKAEQLQEMMQWFGLDAKIIIRKHSFVVYIKDSEQIVDMLNIVEAHQALLKLENIRIYKGMRNSVNRQVNCDAANIRKTVSAATEQINDIQLIQATVGLETLPRELEEIALARLKNPEAPMKELGESLQPAVGKSGVNHRFRRIKAIAEKIREEHESKMSDSCFIMCKKDSTKMRRNYDFKNSND